jgi:enoyl-CoA hydratase
MVLERERRGRVEILRLNRPEARNAINEELTHALEAALDEIEQDRDAWCVVLTGAGPVFSAGADLKEVASGRGKHIATRRGGFAGIVERTIDKPLIAAVNGPALAGGFEIVLACDLVVAAESATFGLPEVTRGLVALGGGPIRLAKRIALAAAFELVLTGDPIPAARAHELGLVNRVVPDGHVTDDAVALAERIGQNSPGAVRVSKRLLLDSVDLTTDQAWARSNALAKDVWKSADAIEGATAFAEKRAPVWNDPDAAGG